MTEHEAALENSIHAGYEVRDAWFSVVAAVGMVMGLGSVPFELFLWQLSKTVAPAQRVPGAAPPVDMPGEPPVNQRLEAIRPPRLDPLQPLRAAPASYRSSNPVPSEASRTQHPQDLWPINQQGLHKFQWVEAGKVARIPIDHAMDAVVDASRRKKTEPQPQKDQGQKGEKK